MDERDNEVNLDFKDIVLETRRRSEYDYIFGGYILKLKIKAVTRNNREIIIPGIGDDCFKINVVMSPFGLYTENVSISPKKCEVTESYLPIDNLRSRGIQITGNKLLDLLDEINEKLGVKFCLLNDMSTIKLCQKNQDFGIIRILTHGETWYQSKGYQPTFLTIPEDIKSQDEFDELVNQLQIESQYLSQKYSTRLKSFLDKPVEMKDVDQRFILEYPTIGGIGREILRRLSQSERLQGNGDRELCSIYNLYIQKYFTDLSILKPYTMIKFYS